MKTMKMIGAWCIAGCTWCAVYGQTPQGAMPGLFSVSENKQVYFSQGNLVKNTNGTWSFAEHQYDDGDLFTWASSGYNGPEIGNQNIAYGYWDGEGSTYANYDWGVYNPIVNGGNVPGLWRTLTRDEWDYLLQNHTCTWTTEAGVQGLKIMADEGDAYVFLPAAGWKNSIEGESISGKGTDGNYWTCSSGSDSPYGAEAFHFMNTTPPWELWANHERTCCMSVRLVYDNNAWITIKDNEDNKALLEQHIPSDKTLPINVHLVRSLTMDMYNTLCLPFDLTANDVKEAFGEDTKVAKFTSGDLSDDKKSLDVVFEEVGLSIDADIVIKAGEPYLIQPSKQVTTTHFYNRVIKQSTADGESFEETGIVQYVGILNPHKLTPGNTKYLFLQANNILAWSKAGDTSTMKGMRGYFYVPGMPDMPASCPARLSVRPAAHTPTDLPSSSSSTPSLEKFLLHGQFVIIKDNKMYNAQGIQL